MKFLQSYQSVIQEREYFTNLYKKTESIVNELEQELKKIDVIKSGTRVKVRGITFCFYKTGTRWKGTFAVSLGNKTIKLYMASIYGDTEDFNYLKKGLPKKVRSLLMHELSHAEEEDDFLEYGMRDNFETDFGDYYNSTTEINARILEDLKYNITPYIKQLASKGDYQHAFRLLMKGIKKNSDFSWYEAKNKNKVIKTLYTTFLNLIDDIEI